MKQTTESQVRQADDGDELVVDVGVGDGDEPVGTDDKSKVGEAPVETVTAEVGEGIDEGPVETANVGDERVVTVGVGVGDEPVGEGLAARAEVGIDDDPVETVDVDDKPIVIVGVGDEPLVVTCGVGDERVADVGIGDELVETVVGVGVGAIMVNVHWHACVAVLQTAMERISCEFASAEH